MTNQDKTIIRKQVVDDYTLSAPSGIRTRDLRIKSPQLCR